MMIPPQNNPMPMILAMLQRGGNPNSMLTQLARQNPQVAQVMNLLGGKTPEQQRTIAENIARERGVNLEELMRQLGIQVPSNR